MLEKEKKKRFPEVKHSHPGKNNFQYFNNHPFVPNAHTHTALLVRIAHQIDDSADPCYQILRLSFLGALDLKLDWKTEPGDRILVRNVVRDFNLPSRTAVLDILPVS